MKRVFLSLAMAAMAVAASAQVTWNVRATAGISIGDHEDFDIGGMVQANIPFSKTSKFTFSPTLSFIHDFGVEQYYGVMPLYIGFQKRLSNGSLFFPKIGPAVGYSSNVGYCDPGFLCGPSIDLAFEVKHFVFGVNAFYSLMNLDDGYYSEDLQTANVSFTIGYKF